MDPKGRNPGDVGLLEYLEDIIGSNKHVERIAELDGKTEELDETRIEAVNRFKVALNEVRKLSGDCKEAADWIAKEREFLKLQTYKFYVNLHTGIQEYNNAIAKLNKMREELQVIKNER